MKINTAEKLVHQQTWMMQCTAYIYCNVSLVNLYIVAKHRSVFLFICYSKVKTGYSYSGTVSLTATGGCRLFCSALPVRSA